MAVAFVVLAVILVAFSYHISNNVRKAVVQNINASQLWNTLTSHCSPGSGDMQLLLSPATSTPKQALITCTP
jgi:hypothetical protein